MNSFSQKKFISRLKLLDFLKISLYFIPISLILGNAAVNINSFISIVVLGLIFFFNSNSFDNYKKIFSIFLLFFFIIILNILFSEDIKHSLISSLGIVRYFFLMIAILYCLEKDEKFLFNYSRLLMLILLFVACDTLFQYFYGKDIFGIEPTAGNFHGQRLNGPFGDEYVVGAYISKFFFISLIFFTFLNKNFIYFFLYLIFICSITLLTKERMASLMIIFSTGIFLFLSSKVKAKIKILYVSIFFIFCSFLIMNNESIKNHLILRSLDQLGLNNIFTADKDKKKIKNSANIRLIYDSQWGAHFLTSYNIFIDNPIMGSGIKTFRLKCSDEKYEKIDSKSYEIRCNTHPHNIYLEIISETGLSLFLPFVLLNLFIFYKLIISTLNYGKDNNLSLLIFCGFVLLFFPIQTTGSFFSTWNGFYYWFIYAFVAFEFRRSKN